MLNIYYIALDQEYQYFLIVSPEYLALKKFDAKSLPIVIDFHAGKMRYRRQHLSLRKEALSKALGLKSTSKVKILDATAGLAQDSFILACLGFEVTLIERSPVIHALIMDGIQRAVNDAAVKRLHLIHADAISWMKQCSESQRPDLIYLDPMFPERKKTALVKHEMRIFHDIVGDDLDADELLAAALACARQRVVVKRSRLAESLAGPKPSYCLKGRSSRFDVYII